MTVYYVRKSGSDSNDGLSAGAAWLTVGHAEAAIVAGDTVYVGPGVYREMWTVSTVGSAGSVITFYADVLGIHTGDTPGHVLISGCDAMGNRVRTNGMEITSVLVFRVWHNFIFQGATGNAGVGGSGVVSTNTEPNSYEGVEFHRCSFLTAKADEATSYYYGLLLPYGTAISPSTTGLLLRYCTIHGLRITYSYQANANVDVKAHIDRCLITGGASNIYIVSDNTATTPAYTIGGISIRNCTIRSSLYTSYPVYIRNLHASAPMSVIEDCVLFLYAAPGTTIYGPGVGPLTIRRFYIVFGQHSYSGSGFINEGIIAFHGEWIFAGIFDFGVKALLESVGVHEPNWSVVTDEAIGGKRSPNRYARNAIVDAYGTVRGQHLPISSVFTGTATDPDAAWISEANVRDFLLSNSTYCSHSGAGSATAKYIQIAGTETLGSLDVGTVHKVVARVYTNLQSGTTGDLGVEISTSDRAEVLTTSILTVVQASDYFDVEVIAPSGGWTKEAIEGLNFRAWRNSAPSQVIYLYLVEALVFCGGAPPYMPGIVDSQVLPVLDTSQHEDGSSSLKLLGEAMIQRFVAASIATYNVSVQVRRDSNYAGAMPTLSLVDTITGSVLAYDTMAGSANAWEELTLSYEFAAYANAAIRMQSYCTTVTGICWFDNLVVAKE